ncbi:MAG TPA: CBS domain-containing protein [Pyrinomonadaceae bacterium]|nr:CBS domain-containing protein [Pyrinomonadaceae bacterium]
MICPSCGTENIDGNDRCENCLSSFRDLDIPNPDVAEGLARHVMKDKLSELQKETPIIVAPDTSAIDVATRMKELNTGCALVLDGPKLVGIFTEHDVLRRMSANLLTQRGGSPDRGRAQQHDEAAPVIPIEGIPLTNTPFSEIPMEEIRVDEMSVEEALAEVEVARSGAKEEANDLNLSSALQVPVKELMSPNPETLHEHESVAFALNKMSLGRYRHIPVEKADGTYTVASIKSVLKYIAQEDW